MANVQQSLLKDWQDQDVMKAADYKRERDLLVTAINDTDTRVKDTPTRSEVEGMITDSELRDHKGTWQGYTPAQLSTVVSITPESIGAARQADLDATNAKVTAIETRVYSMASYQRQGGETDDIGRVNRAIAAVPAGGTLYFPQGLYVFDSITISKPITIIFDSDSDVTPTAIDKDIFRIFGTASGTNYKLSASVARKDKQFTLTTTPTDLQVGDMIVLTDDTTEAGGATNLTTEVHEIEAINGAQITIKGFVRFPKTPAASNINVYKVTPVEGVTIRNFKFKPLEGSTTGHGVTIDLARNVRIENITGSRIVSTGVYVTRSMDITVDRFRFKDPQLPGSGGKGIGVRFYGGCAYVTVRDGLTNGCRSAVRFDATYEALVENVVARNSVYYAFSLSHYGWVSDLTVRSCRAYDSEVNAAVADTQAVSDPSTLTFYNINLIDCELFQKEAVNYSALWFSAPLREGEIRNVVIRNGRGLYGGGTTNNGIRVYPVRNDLVISDCLIEGFKRGIALDGSGTVPANDSRGSKVTVRDTRIRSVDSGFFFSNGTKRSLQLYNITLESINLYLFENTGGTFAEFVINGLTLANSASATMFSSNLTADSGEAIRGVIHNIQTDRNPYAFNHSSASPGWTISMEQALLNGDGQSILIRGTPSASASSGNILPPGIVEGQRLFITTPSSGTWTLNKGSNIVFKAAAASIGIGTGASDYQTASFIWRNSQAAGFWFQI